jgi:DNA-binding NarL/FixJ family response regulator
VSETVSETVSVTRVVVADDQALIRTAIRTLLESASDIEVVAEAADGREAVSAVERHRPDVVLMDIRMPVLDGIEATRAIRALDHGVAVIVLTTYDLDQYVFQAVRAGAVGFFLKDGDAETLLDGIRLAATGQAVLAPSALRALVDEFARMPGSDADAASALSTLTPRETEVLAAMAEGATNAEIARRLFISETTVKTHVGSVLAKLDARDRTQAVVTAWRGGLGRRPA